ncbi:DUF6591 domain-containing protein [Trueperella abortisuis]|uniref:DUF6591 domain-containing protein n=1 Tax=Trueperella abortisuis TaxID=445930 RepID=A0ABT9PL54_9ACTO|nr:DUF6591 domain-containing protein [Trueperella abortisuis]MDP9832640.1 hypothetical protein [Trueperella abortisuis]
MWKKLAAIAGVAALSFSLTACGNNDDAKPAADPATSAAEVTSAPAETTEAPAPATNDSSASSGTAQGDWHAFIDEYEKFVDDYLAYTETVLQKGSYLEEAQKLNDLSRQGTELAAKAEEVKTWNLSQEDTLEYTRRLQDLNDKLLKAAENVQKATASGVK